MPQVLINIQQIISKNDISLNNNIIGQETYLLNKYS